MAAGKILGEISREPEMSQSGSEIEKTIRYVPCRTQYLSSWPESISQPGGRGSPKHRIIEKGLRLWAATPLFDMVAGPGFEPGTFGLGPAIDVHITYLL
jgi:hypothetical protein